MKFIQIRQFRQSRLADQLDIIHLDVKLSKYNLKTFERNLSSNEDKLFTF